MLNVIVAVGVIFSLIAGRMFIAGFEPVVWGKRGVFLPQKSGARNAEPMEWDHAHVYRLSAPKTFEEHESSRRAQRNEQ